MKKPFIRYVISPTPLPASNLPFRARSVGHRRMLRGYRGTATVKHFVEVFWGIAGVGVIVINGVERRINPGQIALYFPGMRHDIYALDPEWEYCWWTMDGPLAAAVTTSLGLTADVYNAGAAPLALLRRLGNLIRKQSPAAEHQASVLAYQLLTLAVSGFRAEANDPRASEAVRIIHSEWNQPQLCVKQLADRLHMHRSSLSRRFKAATGIPPVIYLIRLRVQNALSLLRQTEKPIAEVSALCGYTKQNYFARQIHRSTGFSPLQFRNESLLKFDAVPRTREYQTDQNR